jgi:hypothetical protein
MGGMAAWSAAGQGQSQARKTGIYRLDFWYLRQGSQGTRVNEFLSSQLPLLAKNSQALGIFTVLIGEHLPATLVLAGFPGVEEMMAAEERVRGNAEYRAAFEKMEQGAEPPYDRQERVILRATDFSLEIVPLKEKPKTPRVYELRVYHSPTERQLGFLHERFAGPETRIFHRSGIHPVLYADTIAGPHMPNMTYLTPFDSLADREKAWDRFAADSEWVKVRAESIARGGQLVAESHITLLQPAPFSPMQ